MAILNPRHLLQQAERLLEPANSSGLVRQADRRRAISSAYYAVFHFMLAALADEFVGKTERKTARYALAYRSIDHGSLAKLCKVVSNPRSRDKLAPFASDDGFGADIERFASLMAQVKEKRTAADYDPSHWVTIKDSRQAITDAGSAIEGFKKASVARRHAFLTLLVFPMRT
jgi:hypothetical protein